MQYLDIYSFRIKSGFEREKTNRNSSIFPVQAMHIFNIFNIIKGIM